MGSTVDVSRNPPSGQGVVVSGRFPMAWLIDLSVEVSSAMGRVILNAMERAAGIIGPPVSYVGACAFCRLHDNSRNSV
jgi:hypothetical protein